MTITRINTRLSDDMVVEEVYRTIYDGEEFVCFLAKIGNRKVAELTTGIKIKERIMIIKGINVESGFRDIGIGGALMDFAEKFASSKGITKISLRAYSHDTSPEVLRNLRNWYTKMGYIQQDGYMFKNLESGTI